MLAEKPWKLEAIVRLFLSVFVCHYLGSIALAVVQVIHGGAQDRTGWFFALAAGCVAFSAAVLFMLRKPWELERFARRFAVLLGCLYAGLTLGVLAQQLAGPSNLENPTWRTVVGALSFQGSAIFFTWRFVREHQMRWADAFGFGVSWKLAVLYGALAACIFLPVAQVLQQASSVIMSRLNLQIEVQTAVRALTSTVTWVDRLAVGVAALVLAPVAEEMLFRGVLYPAVKRAGYPRAAVWGTSLLFAAIHGNLPTFLPLLLLALMLTLLYEKTNNLLAPIAGHALFNALNFIRYYIEFYLRQSG